MATQRFTRPEREAINAGYAALEAIAADVSHSDTLRIADALKHEKQFRGDRLVAKAFMVTEFLGGYDAARRPYPFDYQLTPGYLWQMSSGLSVAHMFGAYVALLTNGYVSPERRSAMEACIEAHTESLARFHADILREYRETR